ncbi:MAG: hypothetical protein AAGN46_07225 [Acidobacteriota bacterium]
MAKWHGWMVWAVGSAMAAAGLAATTHDVQPDEPPRVEVLPRSCEVALALSAAPAHLRDDATVYVFERDGFVQVRTGTNPFTCIVNRDDPRVLKPTCFDREGARTVLPKILAVGEMLADQVSTTEIATTIDRGFTEGRFERPGPGIAYMLSRYNRPVHPATGELGWFPPHVMFYAPDLTPDDIGFSMDAFHENPRLPSIGYRGPHGFFIMLADDGTPRRRSDLPTCPDWVRAGAPDHAAHGGEGHGEEAEHAGR